MKLLSFSTYMTNTDIYECSLTPVAILDTKCKGNVIEWKVIRVPTRSVILVIAVYYANHFPFLNEWTEVFDPPPLLR
jgi:hypothetical protein